MWDSHFLCLFAAINERGSLSVAIWCFCSSIQPLTSSGVTHGRVTSSLPLITCVLTGTHALPNSCTLYSPAPHSPPPPSSLVSFPAPALASVMLFPSCSAHLAVTFDPCVSALVKTCHLHAVCLLHLLLTCCCAWGDEGASGLRLVGRDWFLSGKTFCLYLGRLFHLRCETQKKKKKEKKRRAKWSNTQPLDGRWYFWCVICSGDKPDKKDQQRRALIGWSELNFSHWRCKERMKVREDWEGLIWVSINLI